MQLEKKIIVITKEKNPRLYKVLRRKGGTVKFNSVVMTIKKQPKNLLQKISYHLKTLIQKNI